MKLNSFVKDAPVWLYTFALAIVVGATIYQMMVIIPEFTRHMPASMIALANSQVKPGNFWGSPIVAISTTLIPIIAMILNWKTPRRKWLFLSFGFGIAASVFTSMYFYPRLKIMGLFGEPPTKNMELLIVTIKEWVFADHFRFWLTVVPAFFFALKAASVSTKSKVQKVEHPVAVKAQEERIYAL